jgi:uncharacterized protein
MVMSTAAISSGSAADPAHTPSSEETMHAIKFIFTAVALCSTAGAQATEAGKSWVGQFTIDGKATVVTLHERPPAGPAVIDIPSVGASAVPLLNVSAHQASRHFELQGPGERLVFDGQAGGRWMQGTVRQGKASGKFALTAIEQPDPVAYRALAGSYRVSPDRVIDIGMMGERQGQLVYLDHKTMRAGVLYGIGGDRFAAGPSMGIAYPFAVKLQFLRNAGGAVAGLRWQEGARTLKAAKVAPHRVEEVSVQHGDVTLKGSLTLPAGPGPHPAVVFAHGSGDAVRDVGPWNMFFVRQGLAVLSLDKRGAGQSGGDWRSASLDDIAGDWLAGIAMLRQRADIDSARIGVHGSSQGGWTAALMAARSPGVAWVIVRAGSAAPVVDTMVYEIGWSVREAGLSEAHAQAAQDASRRLFALSGAPWPEFDAYAGPLKSQPWASHAWPLHQSKDGWGRKWNALNAAFDPAATLAQVKVPVLWFLGELDHNVPGERSVQLLDAARRASGNPDVTVRTLPGTGHSFMQSATGDNKEFAASTHMVQGYWDTMDIWLGKRGFSRK